MTIKKKIVIDVDTGDAGKDIDNLEKGVKNTAKSSKDAQKGLGGMTGMTKKLGVAFKAMGIGLIITAFMKLKDLFSGNIETARKFERAGAKISAMFDVIRDRAEPLFEKLMQVFTDPKQAIKDLWQALKENIANRIEALIDTFKAFGKVIKGVFKMDLDLIKEGANDAKDSFVQLATGLDDAQQAALKDGFKSATKEMIEEGKAADALTLKLQQIRDAERDMLLVRAQANKIIAESRLLAEDDNLSMQERLDALKNAVAEEKRVADLEMKIQQDKVNALQGLIDLGKSSEEDIQALAQERARLIELQTASVLKQKRVAAEIGSFTNQIAKEEERIEKERLERIDLLVKAKEYNLEITEEMTNKEIKALVDGAKKKEEIEKKQAEKQKADRDKALEEIKQAGMSKEELELYQADQKYQKLLEKAQKYGEDTTLITEEYEMKKAEIENRYAEEERNRRDANANQAIDTAQNILGSLNQIANEEITAQQQALDEQLESGEISQEEYDKATAKLNKEREKKNKRTALAQILIDTAQSIAGAIKAGAGVPFPGNLLAIATGVGAALSGIASAKAVMNSVGGGGDDGGGGGDETVDLTPQGGQGAQDINMENIDAPTLGGSQPAQAYVVESDISDAQALQEELDIQATL